MPVQTAGLREVAANKTGFGQFGLGVSLGFAGAAGFVGGSLVLGAYSWLAALAAVAMAILFARPASRPELELALRESEQRLRVITDNLPALVSYVDAEERYRFHNRAHEQWLQLTSADIAGRTVREVWGEARYALLKPNVERALRGELVSHEFTVVQSGVERRVLAAYVPDLDASGRPRGFFVLGSDITQLADAQDELRRQRSRLEAALDGSSAALWDTDLRSGRVYLSEAWADIVGAPRGETVTTIQALIALLHPDDVEQLKRISVDVLKGAKPSYAAEHRVRTRDGEWRWIISRGRVTERDPVSARALRMIGTNFDITDRKRMEEALQSVALTDALTGLANRRLFRDRLTQALARARRAHNHVALVYVDLDGFKQINDSLGHAGGDAMLKDFAARLRAGVRASDTVARLGGDEFVVILEDVKDPLHAAHVAEKVVAECRRPLVVDGREVVATASAGVVVAAGDSDPEALLRRADAALYEAKRAGRNGYRVAR